MDEDIGELITEAKGIADDLENAESCETWADFIANLETAYTATNRLMRDLEACIATAKKDRDIDNAKEVCIDCGGDNICEGTCVDCQSEFLD